MDEDNNAPTDQEVAATSGICNKELAKKLHELNRECFRHSGILLQVLEKQMISF